MICNEYEVIEVPLGTGVTLHVMVAVPPLKTVLPLNVPPPVPKSVLPAPLPTPPQYISDALAADENRSSASPPTSSSPNSFFILFRVLLLRIIGNPFLRVVPLRDRARVQNQALYATCPLPRSTIA